LCGGRRGGEAGDPGNGVALYACRDFDRRRGDPFRRAAALLPAFALLLLLGIFGGFFIVPLNALLQERGKHTVGAGNAIAVQNLGENVAMLLMLGLYSLAVSIGIPVVGVGIGFGAVFAWRSPRCGCGATSVVARVGRLRRHLRSPARIRPAGRWLSLGSPDKASAAIRASSTLTVPGRYKPDAPLQSPLIPLRSAQDANFPRWFSAAPGRRAQQGAGDKRLTTHKGQRHLRRVEAVTLAIST
jgi:hypothetical protein